jgi:hypothetical protein
MLERRLSLLASGLLAACGGPSRAPDRSLDATPEASMAGASATESPAVPGDDGRNVATTGDAPSYWQDVAPVFYDKCVGCHQAGGIAPFALDDYPIARQRANQIAAVTAARIMPPYLMETGGSCGSFDESRALSAAQIELLQTWANAGAPEGQRRDLSRPELPTLGEGRAWSTPEFTPTVQDGALAQFDEYRCFRVELGLSGDSWVTGWEVTPGNPQLVHHLIAFIVDPAAQTANGSNDEIMQALDAESPDRDGWPCYGAAGESVRVESSPVVWAPGAGAVGYPYGVGIRLRQNRQLVVQVHYNLARAEARGQSDQSRIQLRLADSVERQGFFLLEDEFLDAPPGESLAPGQASVSFSWTKSASSALGGLALPVALDLVAVSPHMHTRGRAWTLELGNSGAFSCIGRVPRWDFNWQSMYTYTTPPQLRSGSALRLTCEYDTSADTEPVLPGWGTQNEMCLATLLLALPPGLILP